MGQDEQALEAIARISLDKAEGTRAQQNSLMEAFEQQEHSDEHMIYSEIKAMRKQQAKLKADFQDYILRTSNYEALKEAKKEQMASIENSRGDYTVLQHPFFHNTSVGDNLNATVFASLRVTSDNVPLVLEQRKTAAKHTQPTTAASSRKAAFFDQSANQLDNDL